VALLSQHLAFPMEASAQGLVRPHFNYEVRSVRKATTFTLIRLTTPVMVRFKGACRAALGLQTVLALVTVLTLSSAQADLIETNRDQPGSQSKWNRSGSAVCPDGYDYVARIRRGVARTFTAGSVPAQRNRRGSAVCPEGSNYQARYKACLPQ
jgi:hypothetical protein